MMTRTREAFFECSFTSDRGRRTAHVRAWSAAEAERLFRESLADEGVREPGTIAVTGAGRRTMPQLAPGASPH